MSAVSASLEAFREVADDHFLVLDQLKLPVLFEEIKVDSLETTWRVIKDMNVRGAPLISVVATLGIKVELFKRSFASAEELRYFVRKSVEFLRTSRPTAVNLQNDTERLLNILDKNDNIDALKASIYNEVQNIKEGYVKACADMSRVGVDAILADFANKPADYKFNVMTVCNTGKLATPGEGTALGIVRELLRRGRLERLFITETRPYNQGARLTAFEAVFENIPATLITDNMAAALMHQGKVDLVVTGADRVTKNGDTANKIGTYSLAVLSKHHKVKFYVALPTSTIDESTACGDDIHIEERPSTELTQFQGIQIAPPTIHVWNPCFDVTPSSLITRIFHEGGEYACDRTLGEWRQVNAVSLTQILTTKYPVFSAEEAKSLKVSEIGDGNLNLVFLVSSPSKSVIIKQALPYVRCIGPSWPFPLSRAHFEYQALIFQNIHVPELIPTPLFFDDNLALIGMEYLSSPYAILRKGMIQQQQYQNLSRDVANFSARTHFFSSALHLSCSDFRAGIAKWSINSEMCTLTEQVIFHDPYVEAPLNKWNTPLLDDIVSDIKDDANEKLLLQVLALRTKFLSAKEVLLHGDLHSGSIMATTEGQVKIIDPEFAFYGPIAFDIGMFIANLFLSYFSQMQHSASSQTTTIYSEWILQTTEEFYNQYTAEFKRLWDIQENGKDGGLFPQSILAKNPNLLKSIQNTHFNQVFTDTLGFAAVEIIRRIIGVAHVEDLESIEDPAIRAKCEIPSLLFAKNLLVNVNAFTNISQVLLSARSFFNETK